MTKLLLTIASFLIFIPTTYAQYALEASLGAPYVESLQASADGESLAWVTNEAGARNIWWTSVDDAEPQPLTSFRADDGLGINIVGIVADHLLFVRGNGNNRQGQPANPSSLPYTPVRQLFRIQLSSGELDTLDQAAGSSMAMDGLQLIFAKAGGVSVIEDVTAQEVTARRLFEVRSGAGSLVWSTSDDRIAFVGNRGDHSFVGVYEPASDDIRWMAPAFGLDTEPVWSPDGSQIAFIRTPGRRQGELRNIMSGNPFEIIVADTKTGVGRSIWQSPGDDGGFSQYYPSNSIRWTRGNQILFYSEHEGWNHLYAIEPDGTNLRDLTPGDYELENHTLSLDHQYVYCTSNREDTNRRHIWRIDLSSGSSAQLTDAEGIQTHPVALSGGTIAYREGFFNRPTGVTLQKGGERRSMGSIPKGYPADAFVEPRAVTFQSADGLTIHGQLFDATPRSKSAKPAVIFMHGGPIRQMLLGYHYSGYYANAYVMNQYLASQGYVVLS
ncbi:MAG: DPP IV N-terminal domain-containing protein, partial [Bacteroidota bacterium]